MERIEPRADWKDLNVARTTLTALREEARSPIGREAVHLLLEDVDELVSDPYALLVRVGDPGERETRRRVGLHEVEALRRRGQAGADPKEHPAGATLSGHVEGASPMTPDRGVSPSREDDRAEEGTGRSDPFDRDGVGDAGAVRGSERRECLPGRR